jgi:hypothetical protein
VTPSGLEYYIRVGSVYDPAPATTDTLYHAIAVAIPE